MSWNEILNHERPLERFRRSMERSRLACTYLFVGPEGIGKRLFAHKLAQSLLCETNPEIELNPCGSCPGCQQVLAKTHPDLILVSKPVDKAYIPIDLFIGDKEHRRQEGLCHDIGLKPFRGGRKIAIIDDADALNQEGANSLLKTLEEPPPNSLLILIGTTEQTQLPTIVSRSQVVRFQRLSNRQVLTILEQNSLTESESIPLSDLADASDGSVSLAIKLSDPEAFEFRGMLFNQLAGLDPGQRDFAKTVTGFVDAVGKDAASKRARLSLVGDLAIMFYRQWYLQLTETVLDPHHTDPVLNSAVEPAVLKWRHSINQGAEVAARCIERSSEMQRHIRANAGTANVVDAWLRDLGRIGRGEFSTVV